MKRFTTTAQLIKLKSSFFLYILEVVEIPESLKVQFHIRFDSAIRPPRKSEISRSSAGDLRQGQERHVTLKCKAT